MILTRADFDREANGESYFSMDLPGMGFESPDSPMPTFHVDTIGIIPKLSALPTQGYVHGGLIVQVIRLLPDQFSSGAVSAGVVCLASSRNFTATGTGYALEYHPVNGNLVLSKWSSGFAGRTILDSRFLGEGDRTIGFIWLVDPYAAKWVVFLVFVDNLVIPLYKYQDFFAPLYTTGITEGFFFVNGDGAAFTFAFSQALLSVEV